MRSSIEIYAGETSTEKQKAGPMAKPRTPSTSPRPKHSTARVAPSSPKVEVATSAAETAAGSSSAPVEQTPVLELRKKELIDQVVARSGVKKRDAKPVVEAMLAVLGESIDSARPLHLEPMGKLRVNRSKDTPNGRIHICKLRRKPAIAEMPSQEQKTASTPLAKPER